MQIINMKLSEIHPYEKNPRFNDGAVEAVANSIKEFCRGQGFRRGCRAHPPESGGTARSHGSSGGDRGKPHAGTGAGVSNRGQQDRRDRGVELRC